ncbi:UDP-3-O-(3-hydroxymyristoyl)glucosamine N-acyltransferase [bacterium]|nr:UDP-3-O-(3-hydroxymyristoyl)glucosamine N-acyltransferase [bacterium]
MSLHLSKIAEIAGGELAGDGTVSIQGVARIEDAKAGDISFLANTKYVKYLENSPVSALIVPKTMVLDTQLPLIRADNPYFAFLKVVAVFYPPEPLIEKGVHKTAVIAETSKVGQDVSIGAYVVIGENCQIGDRCVILPGAVLGHDVVVGEECVIHANVSLREGVRLGKRVILHNGVVLGSDGFGFTQEEGKYHKIPQVGTVVVEDDVEIGANTAVDRSMLGETRICRGAKIDNLVQIGHNCTVGDHTVISGQTGLSGSTHIGNYVRVGGQAGFSGHIHIGDRAAIGAQAGVSKDVMEGTMVSGYPAKPHREELKMEAAVRRLPAILKEFKALQTRVRDLEEKLKKLC